MNTARRTRLSPQRIVDAALELAGQQGVSKVSARRIAQRLGVTSMAIYRHFEDMYALQSEMLDQYVLRAEVLPPGNLPWDRWLQETARRMFTALRQEPDWIPLFGRIRLKAGALGVMDACLAVLQSAGFSPARSVEVYFAMVQWVIGAASVQAALDRSNAEQAFPLARFAPTEFPAVSRTLPELLSVMRSDMLEDGIDWLIQALEAELESDRGTTDAV